MAKKQKIKKTVEAIKHDQASRKNIPTAEHQSLMGDKDKSPVQVAYERRNRLIRNWSGVEKMNRTGLIW